MFVDEGLLGIWQGGLADVKHAAVLQGQRSWELGVSVHIHANSYCCFVCYQAEEDRWRGAYELNTQERITM